jgi:hypothetical protein
MKSRRVLLIALAAGLFGCGGPFFIIPGGALDGPVAPVPDDVGFARDAGTIQLETRPTDPYSVNIVTMIVGDSLYISAGDTRTEWVAAMEEDPRVRVRIKGTIYEFRVHRVTDDAEMRAFAAEWTKNAWARDPLELEEVWVYRLARR